MSEPQSERSEELTFEQRVLRSTLNKLEKLLDELTEKAFTNNQIKVLLQNLERQLNDRHDIKGERRDFIKSILDYANHYVVDIEDYIDYANNFFSEIREDGLDLAHIKLKLSGIYIQLLGIMQKVWSIEAIYAILCHHAFLCDELYHNKMWEIYRAAEFALFEIFTYLINL